MKKISVFLFAAMLFGIGSAFTTIRPSVNTQAYGLYNGNWYAVNTDDVNITYRCNVGSEYCLFASENTNDPLPAQTQDKQFVPIP